MAQSSQLIPQSSHKVPRLWGTLGGFLFSKKYIYSIIYHPLSFSLFHNSQSSLVSTIFPLLASDPLGIGNFGNFGNKKIFFQKKWEKLTSRVTIRYGGGERFLKEERPGANDCDSLTATFKNITPPFKPARPALRTPTIPRYATNNNSKKGIKNYGN